VVITDLHTQSDESESFDTDSRSEEADGDSDSSFDPLDEVPSNNEIPRRRLFNDTFGDVGLAASIFQILGTPTPETWPVSLLHGLTGIVLNKQDFKTLPNAEKIEFRPTDPVSLASLFPDMDPQLVDLVGGLLQLSPGRRVQAKDALGHACFDRTLVPSASVYADARCLEVVDGRRLSDHISDELKVKREQWQPASQ
jgi:serine/threonine protein kinase